MIDSAEPRVFIVLLNYKSALDSVCCLESLQKLAYTNYRVVWVDNFSQDSSSELIQRWAEGGFIAPSSEEVDTLSPLFTPPCIKPISFHRTTSSNLEGCKFSDWLTIVDHFRNDGFASGNNIAIDAIRSNECFDFIWLLNCDTVVEPNALRAIVDFAVANDTGVTGSTLLHYYHPSKIQALGGVINRRFGTGMHVTDINHRHGELDYIVGASFLISRPLLDAIGVLPEEYFMYYEETDYCFQAKRAGFKIGVSSSSKVYHKEGGTNLNNTRTDFAERLMIKNRIMFHQKFLGSPNWLIVGLLISLVRRISRLEFCRALHLTRTSIATLISKRSARRK